MVFLIGLDSFGYKVCNDDCSKTTYADKSDLKNMKVCPFYKDRIVSNSLMYTVLGKFYTGKEKSIKYLVCDNSGKRYSKSKSDILNMYKSNIFTNITVTKNNAIKFKSGLIPFIGRISRSKKEVVSTVIKIGDISGSQGSIGVGKKFLGKKISNGDIGCVKFELFPNSYDIRNEVLAYRLGCLLDFDVAKATYEKYKDNKCIMSKYNYDMGIEIIKSLKSYTGTENFHSKFNMKWLEDNFGMNTVNKFLQMVMIDLMMHQTDRHISNIAFKGKELYSLYDNGRSLFYDENNGIPDGVDLTNRGSIVNSFVVNEHGYGWMYLEDVLGYKNYKHLIRHDIEYSDIKKIVNECYGNSDVFRNNWIAEYIYKVYLIIIRQERRFV